MATEQIKNPILIELLKENRDNLNSLFNFYKLTFPSLEKDVVFFYLSFVIEPFFDRYKIKDKSELSSLLLTLYERILELIGKNYLGNSGRYPFFENNFIRLIENGDDRIFENPDFYISSVANAIFNIGSTDVFILDKWISSFLKLIPKAKTNKELFEAGKVASWLFGMSQYRSISLLIIRSLSIELLEIILGNSNIRNINRDKFISRLESDPWIKPENAMKENTANKKIQITKASGFTGFGGHFISPPKVEYLEGDFIVSDTKNKYVLFADAFGYNLQKISEETYNTLKRERKANNSFIIKISSDGKLQNGNEVIHYLPLTNYSSIAGDEHTVCISSPYFHSIFIIGLG